MLASGDGNDQPGNNNPTRLENAHRRKGKGRRKVDMEKIQNGTNCQVTFSKRARPLQEGERACTLCAPTAPSWSSPRESPTPSAIPARAVTNRFLQASGDYCSAATGVNSAERLIRAHNEAAMQQRNQQLANMEAEVERTKQRRREIDGLVPMMGDFNFEQIGQMWNMALQINGQVEEAKQKGVDSTSAAADPFSIVPHDGGAGSSNPAADVDGAPDEAIRAPDEDSYDRFPDNFATLGLCLDLIRGQLEEVEDTRRWGIFTNIKRL
ncbi:agamous-like MADS-box protein AGL62 [Salvia hispanica]|uniref:agamous-like MADS-box protein AGL62 n=1 Tax=Salvia hispanica TaxID=49212 RepID=UPI00200906A6|nr:agamous-like MADS-box protein AGL62 [Salvia hispanica]